MNNDSFLITYGKNGEEYFLRFKGKPYMLETVSSIFLRGLNEIREDVLNSGQLGVMALFVEIEVSMIAILKKVKVEK